MTWEINRSFQADAIQRVTEYLAICPGSECGESLDPAWSSLIVEAAATYLALIEAAGRGGSPARKVDLDLVLDEALRRWRAAGWNLSRDDVFTARIVELAELTACWVSGQ